MKLYDYFRSSAAYRVRIALNVKGVTAERAFVHLRHGVQHGAQYRDCNPHGLVPALALDDGQVITQSMAIIEYLDETYPQPPLLPADAEGRARARHYAGDRRRHPPDRQPARAAVPEVGAARGRRGARHVVRALDRVGVRGAGKAVVARTADRPLLPRRHPDACRLLPGATARQRTSRGGRPGTVSNTVAHRRGVLRTARVRRCSARVAARRRMISFPYVLELR